MEDDKIICLNQTGPGKTAATLPGHLGTLPEGV